MPTGLASRFTILQRSPLDDQPCGSLTPEPGLHESRGRRWIPSRFTVRATTDDGRLLLWNTLSGKITAFKAEDRMTVLNLLKRSGVAGEKRGVLGYLVRRGYLIAQETNEFRKFQHLFAQQHYRPDVLELILMASEDCNFRCSYCYEDFARGTMTPAVRDSLKQFLSARIKRLSRLKLSWFGGEPLYGWEAIEDLAPYFLAQARLNSVPFASHMTTNGYLLTPDVVEKLLLWECRNFQVTLDGIASDHDASRPGRDGCGTFDVIWANLVSIASRGDDFHITLRVNFTPKNSSRLGQLVEQAAEAFRGDSRFSIAFHGVGKWGGANDESLAVCTSEDKASIVSAMMLQARKAGIAVGSLRDASSLGSQVCYAARPFNLLIGATGKVMKCTVALDKDERNVVGQLLPGGEVLLDHDRFALWTEPAFEQDGQCQKCAVLPTCQGVSCPLIRIEDGQRPCLDTRRNSKRRLLELHETVFADASQ
jgi:uncharacterized protein